MLPQPGPPAEFVHAHVVFGQQSCQETATDSCSSIRPSIIRDFHPSIKYTPLPVQHLHSQIIQPLKREVATLAAEHG